MIKARSICFMFALLLHTCFDQAIAQTLPKVGGRLWTLPLNHNPSGALAYAPLSDLVFVGFQTGGEILVVKGASGQLLDIIRNETWYDPQTGSPLAYVRDLSCSLDGTRLLIGYRSVSQRGRVVLIDYPSKQVLSDSVFVGLYQWEHMHIKLSPSGRYSVTPADTGFVQKRIKLHDHQRGNSLILESNPLLPQGDFDSHERYFTYPVKGNVMGTQVTNQVALLQLDSLDKSPKIYNECGTSTLSEDGRLLMIAGHAFNEATKPIQVPRFATVIDIATDSIVWQLKSGPVVDDVELAHFAWSSDASRLFLWRSSYKITTEWFARIFYNFGDSLPNAMMCDTCAFDGSIYHTITPNTMVTSSVANSDLTIGFSVGNWFYGLVAENLSPTTSVMTEQDQRIMESTYPNPTSGNVYLQCRHFNEVRNWAAFSILGDRVAQGSLPIASSESFNERMITLPAHLLSGMYVVVLTNVGDSPLCTHVVVKY